MNNCAGYAHHMLSDGHAAVPRCTPWAVPSQTNWYKQSKHFLSLWKIKFRHNHYIVVVVAVVAVVVVVVVVVVVSGQHLAGNGSNSLHCRPLLLLPLCTGGTIWSSRARKDFVHFWKDATLYHYYVSSSQNFTVLKCTFKNIYYQSLCYDNN